MNVSREAGIDFRHVNGASSDKYLPETMGSGGLIFDYDGDGWPDVFLVNGGSFADPRLGASAQHRLYRNDQDGTFTDTTGQAGLRVSGYGMGACAADFDNDGWADLYVTSVGTNTLYRNLGNGSFADITEHARVGYESWSTSCAFGDIDNDGDVDLFVTNYADFAADNNRYCGDNEGLRYYCHPNVFNALPDVLYRNNGDGTFSDRSAESGVSAARGYGLGVVFGDYDDDGWVDIYVANDSTFNFLFHNKRTGVFEELALLAGVAVGSDGRPQAGMGADWGDIDGDGLPDLFVTNLDRETHSLYRNLATELFADVTFESGVGVATLPYVGFGAVFIDYDNDADLDLAVANGGIFDNPERFRDTTTYEQSNLLLQNDNAGTFEDVSALSGPGFALEKVSRALAAGDLDNDGDLDLLVTNNGSAPDLLRNDRNHSNNALLIRVVGSQSNRDGIGARLKLFIGDDVLLREVRAGSSYLAQSDLRVHYGLGTSLLADRLEISWPSGTFDVLENLTANQIITVVEGEGVVESVPFGNRR